MATSDMDVLTRDDIDTTTKVVMKRPSMFNVILFNDDKTTMEFVILILMSVFQKPFEDASSLTLKIHEEGRGIAGTYSNEVAIQKRNEAVVYARTCNFPLKCEVEEV